MGRDVKAVIRKKHFLPSRWDEDVLRTELGRANVLRTQHLRSQILERGKRCEAEEGAQTVRQARLQSAASDVEGAVSRPHVTHPYEEDVYQSPDAQASEAEQFAQTFSPLAQVKAVGSKAAQRDAEERKQTAQHVRDTKKKLHDPSQRIPEVLFGFGARPNSHLSANAVDHL